MATYLIKTRTIRGDVKGPITTRPETFSDPRLANNHITGLVENLAYGTYRHYGTGHGYVMRPYGGLLEAKRTEVVEFWRESAPLESF